MIIQGFYKYTWFANLAYVNWNPAAVGLDKNVTSAANQAISDANAPGVERVPGQAKGVVDSLGEKIFMPIVDGGEGWHVADYQANTEDTGFSASLFTKETTNEKVLAIRGTEPSDIELFQQKEDSFILFVKAG